VVFAPSHAPMSCGRRLWTRAQQQEEGGGVFQMTQDGTGRARTWQPSWRSGGRSMARDLAASTSYGQSRSVARAGQIDLVMVTVVAAAAAAAAAAVVVAAARGLRRAFHLPLASYVRHSADKTQKSGGAPTPTTWWANY
jgi:hypothetical protein